MDKTKQCLAELHIGDDQGDSRATMVCQLEKGHQGMHLEQYSRMGDMTNPRFETVVLWEGDDTHK